MALLICPECQKEVSEFAEKCINCGCPMEIIKNSQKERLYTTINGNKKDVTYFVNKILDGSYNEDVSQFNIKLMEELDVLSMTDFVQAVRECSGAPAEYNEERLYTIINGNKKDVTYFVNKILDGSYNILSEDAPQFNIKLMDELDVSTIGFVQAVRECNGAPVEYNAKSIKEKRRERQGAGSSIPSKPRCPYCNSTNVEKLSFTKKAISIGGLGILSNKIGKTYQCKNCKSTW